MIRRVAIRVAVSLVALGISFFLLASIFEDLDLGQVLEALGALSDAEIIALASGFLLDVAAQGLMTASLVPGLPVRRGVLAWLGPTAVASVIPGPSDLPVRLRMFRSWGRTSSEAALAITANGLFSIGIKLVLPIVAGVALLVIDFPSRGLGRAIAVAALILGGMVLAAALVVSSDRRVRAVGGVLEQPWRLTLRLLRRQREDPLADLLASIRFRAAHLLRTRWKIASWAALLTSLTRFSLLVICVRFAGVPDAELPWPQMFVAFAVVQGLIAVPITAGNAGVTEAGLIALLTTVSGSQWVNEVTAGVIVYRLLTWIVIIPLGLGALAVWRHDQRDRGDLDALDDIPA